MLTGVGAYVWSLSGDVLELEGALSLGKRIDKLSNQWQESCLLDVVYSVFKAAGQSVGTTIGTCALVPESVRMVLPEEIYRLKILLDCHKNQLNLSRKGWGLFAGESMSKKIKRLERATIVFGSVNSLIHKEANALSMVFALTPRLLHMSNNLLKCCKR